MAYAWAPVTPDVVAVVADVVGALQAVVPIVVLVVALVAGAVVPVLADAVLPAEPGVPLHVVLIVPVGA